MTLCFNNLPPGCVCIYIYIHTYTYTYIYTHTRNILGTEPGANAALFTGEEGHRTGRSAGFTALLVLYTGVNGIGIVYVKRKKITLWTVALLHCIYVCGRNLAERYKSDNMFVFRTEVRFFCVY